MLHCCAFPSPGYAGLQLAPLGPGWNDFSVRNGLSRADLRGTRLGLAQDHWTVRVNFPRHDGWMSQGWLFNPLETLESVGKTWQGVTEQQREVSMAKRHQGWGHQQALGGLEQPCEALGLGSGLMEGGRAMGNRRGMPADVLLPNNSPPLSPSAKNNIYTLLGGEQASAPNLCPKSFAHGFCLIWKSSFYAINLSFPGFQAQDLHLSLHPPDYQHQSRRIFTQNVSQARCTSIGFGKRRQSHFEAGHK